MASNVLNKVRQAVTSTVKLGTFDAALDKLRVVQASPGNCTCEMKIRDKHTNINGLLHGAAIALLIDNVTTLALLSNTDGVRGISVDMNINYLSSAKLGDEIIITGRTEKFGKSVAFLTAEIRNKNTNNIIAIGTHTKFVKK